MVHKDNSSSFGLLFGWLTSYSSLGYAKLRFGSGLANSLAALLAYVTLALGRRKTTCIEFFFKITNLPLYVNYYELCMAYVSRFLQGMFKFACAKSSLPVHDTWCGFSVLCCEIWWMLIDSDMLPRLPEYKHRKLSGYCSFFPNLPSAWMHTQRRAKIR